MRYRFKRAGKAGSTAVDLEPFDLLARHCALVAPPRCNMIRYHGRRRPTVDAGCAKLSTRWVMLVHRFASLAIVGLTMGCGAANPPASPDTAATPPEPAAPEAAPTEPAASAPATAEPAATKPPPAPSGIRTAKGIQIGGRPIETITADDVARVLSAAGYEVRTGTPQPCGKVDQLNFSVGNDAVSAMVAVFRIIEPAPGDNCSPTPVSGYVKTWRHATEGDSPTTVMVYDEAAPSLVVVNAMGEGGQPEAHKVIDALLASPGTK